MTEELVSGPLLLVTGLAAVAVVRVPLGQMPRVPLAVMVALV